MHFQTFCGHHGCFGFNKVKVLSNITEDGFHNSTFGVAKFCHCKAQVYDWKYKFKLALRSKKFTCAFAKTEGVFCDKVNFAATKLRLSLSLFFCCKSDL